MKKVNGLVRYYLLAMLVVSLLLGAVYIQATTNGSSLQRNVPTSLELKKAELQNSFPSILFF